MSLSARGILKGKSLLFDDEKVSFINEIVSQENSIELERNYQSIVEIINSLDGDVEFVYCVATLLPITVLSRNLLFVDAILNCTSRVISSHKKTDVDMMNVLAKLAKSQNGNSMFVAQNVISHCKEILEVAKKKVALSNVVVGLFAALTNCNERFSENLEYFSKVVAEIFSIVAEEFVSIWLSSSVNCRNFMFQIKLVCSALKPLEISELVLEIDRLLGQLYDQCRNGVLNFVSNCGVFISRVPVINNCILKVIDDLILFLPGVETSLKSFPLMLDVKNMNLGWSQLSTLLKLVRPTKEILKSILDLLISQIEILIENACNNSSQMVMDDFEKYCKGFSFYIKVLGSISEFCPLNLVHFLRLIELFSRPFWSFPVSFLEKLSEKGIMLLMEIITKHEIEIIELDNITKNSNWYCSSSLAILVFFGQSFRSNYANIFPSLFLSLIQFIFSSEDKLLSIISDEVIQLYIKSFSLGGILNSTILGSFSQLFIISDSFFSNVNVISVKKEIEKVFLLCSLRYGFESFASYVVENYWNKLLKNYSTEEIVSLTEHLRQFYHSFDPCFTVAPPLLFSKFSLSVTQYNLLQLIRHVFVPSIAEMNLEHVVLNIILNNEAESGTFEYKFPELEFDFFLEVNLLQSFALLPGDFKWKLNIWSWCNVVFDQCVDCDFVCVNISTLQSIVSLLKSLILTSKTINSTNKEALEFANKLHRCLSTKSCWTSMIFLKELIASIAIVGYLLDVQSLESVLSTFEVMVADHVELRDDVSNFLRVFSIAKFKSCANVVSKYESLFKFLFESCSEAAGPDTISLIDSKPLSETEIIWNSTLTSFALISGSYPDPKSLIPKNLNAVISTSVKNLHS